ncbi:MAG TPA: tRNA preQ1(34) S-adenosylmethionine ribosyltransferase-isomerase QueA [Spirochaetota bacterium]|nr:tRNA preQ1(34) S-adenosylmethionine ribosyltransferase-isomerase QueA [Spirochaetota bacterium]HNT10363.1 tRNA preQ1(34) S-adenosylmethionine ribosyltransferase-isomerase QueA [Spirochaetota bacterium]HPU88527.1 tRNA preQ1(34) S-adenosylmethionine ribosyltransferase-isomerase QueA [Spirochaetota bacterium]
MKTNPYTLDDFDFDLPDDCIAHYPTERRDGSRLMVVRRSDGVRTHGAFHEIGKWLNAGDVLVFNDTRVLQARIRVARETGSRIELILLQRIDDLRWEAICSRQKRLRKGETLHAEADGDIELRVADKRHGTIVVEPNQDLTETVLARIGLIPLPPYIKREPDPNDAWRYQTVFAANPGAVAAPTAGLHFTEDLIENLRATGVVLAPLTLYVSWGTFQPVRDRELERHVMHRERYLLPQTTAEAVNAARSESRRIIAIGTTSLRVLEATFGDGRNLAGEGETDLFIYPPRRVNSVDALITNFHTPRSTLLMLVAAFAGYEIIMAAYREAVQERYRFFSYGDAMLIV